MRYKTCNYYPKKVTSEEEVDTKKQTEESVENMNIYIYTNIKQKNLRKGGSVIDFFKMKIQSLFTVFLHFLRT